MQNIYVSAHAIGDEVVVLNNHYGVIVAIRFTESKVTYDVALDVGGEIMRDVDSTFVEVEDESRWAPFEPVHDYHSRDCGDPDCVVCGPFFPFRAVQQYRQRPDSIYVSLHTAEPAPGTEVGNSRPPFVGMFSGMRGDGGGASYGPNLPGDPPFTIRDDWGFK